MENDQFLQYQQRAAQENSSKLTDTPLVPSLDPALRVVCGPFSAHHSLADSNLHPASGSLSVERAVRGVSIAARVMGPRLGCRRPGYGAVNVGVTRSLCRTHVSSQLANDAKRFCGQASRSAAK